MIWNFKFEILNLKLFGCSPALSEKARDIAKKFA